MSNAEIRDQFESWVKSNWPEQSLDRFNPLHGVTDGEYMGFTVQHCWDAWQASRDAAKTEFQPEWHPMSEEPPFPFAGDIFVSGKVITGVTWCAGYWKVNRGGCLDRGSVTHWKLSNGPIILPDV